jgi:hypothetical protein
MGDGSKGLNAVLREDACWTYAVNLLLLTLGADQSDCDQLKHVRSPQQSRCSTD